MDEVGTIAAQVALKCRWKNQLQVVEVAPKTVQLALKKKRQNSFLMTMQLVPKKKHLLKSLEAAVEVVLNNVQFAQN